jgi:Rrf2 family protein
MAKSPGLLSSSRGPHGGYKLAKPADEITVAEVIRVIEGPLAAVGDRAPEATRYRRSAKNLTKVWIATRVALRDSLETITIADIVEDQFAQNIKQVLRRKDAWKRRGT